MREFITSRPELHAALLTVLFMAFVAIWTAFTVALAVKIAKDR